MYFSLSEGGTAQNEKVARASIHLLWLALTPQALNVIVTNGKSPCTQLLVAVDTGQLKESTESHSFHLKRTLIGQVRKGGLLMLPLLRIPFSLRPN